MNTMRRSAASLIALLLSGSAHGGEPAGDATALFDEGTALYREGRFAEAEAKFQASWGQRQAFDTAANLGDCEIEIGQWREAVEHLAYARKSFPVSGEPALKERLDQRYGAALEHVAQVTVRANVAGAALALDGRALGLSPLADKVVVEPGRHELVGKKEGYEPARHAFEAKAKDDLVAELVLRQSVVTPPPNEDAGPEGWVLGVGYGAGAAAIGAGIALLVVSEGHRSDADALDAEIGPTDCAQAPPEIAGKCGELEDTLDSRNLTGNLGVGSLILGGVLAAATTTYLLWPRDAGGAATANHVRILPTASPRGATVVVDGRW